MNIVYVKYDNDNKVHAFQAADQLLDCLCEGKDVIVDTGKGNKKARIAYIVWDKEVSEAIYKDIRKTRSLGHIAGIYDKIHIDCIIVPVEFANNMPQSYKIEDSYGFYREYGRFDRDIVVNKYGVLTDGYAAYLIAKMVDIKELKVLIK